MSKRMLLAALVAAVSWPLSALAGGPTPAHVPAAAKAMFHVDCAALRDTTLYNTHRELKGADNPFDTWLNVFSGVVGFHPLNDLDGVTIYTNNQGSEDGVALWYGKTDQQRILKNVRTWPQYAEQTYQGRTLHTWRDAKTNRTVAGAIVSERVMVSASSIAGLKAALDVIDGRTSGNSSIATAFPKSAIAFAGLKDLPSAPRTVKSGAMANLEALQMTLTENDGKARFIITAEAPTPELALKSKQILDGLKALMQLNNEKNPAAASLAMKITNSADNKLVTSILEGDSRDILKDFVALEKHRTATTRSTLPSVP